MRLSLLFSMLLVATISSVLAQGGGQSGSGGLGANAAFDDEQGGAIATDQDEALDDLFGGGGADEGRPDDTPQKRTRPKRRSNSPARIPNPFDVPKPGLGGLGSDMMGMGEGDMGMMSGMMGGMMGGGMEGGMDEESMEEFGGGMGMGGDGMGMGDMYGMGGMEMGGGETAKQMRDREFREGLQRAITALKKAKTEQQKQVLLGYVREAFENRYDRIVIERKQELERIKTRLEQLESDLQRRVAAKQRVVDIQLQSVQLASEGLLELNSR